MSTRPESTRHQPRWFAWLPRPVLRLLAGVLACALVLSACGADDDDAGSDETAASDDSFAEADADADMAMEEEADVSTVGAETRSVDDAERPPSEPLAQGTALTAADLGRDIIFRADIGVEVADVAAAASEATQRIEALGGIVFGQTTVIDPAPRTVLTFKIQPADFDDALDQLGGVGELVDQTITADDVTARVVDLESRVLTAETSVGRLREFLAGAQTVEDVASLEAELVERELELESLRGQLRTVRDQVALATITLTITEAGLDLQDLAFNVISGLGEGRDDACPGSIELETEREGSVVWCVEIENNGDATLTNVELSSTALGLRSRDFTWLDESPDAIEPGAIGRAIVELEIEDGRIRRRQAIGGLRLDVTVQVSPSDDLERRVTRDASVLVLADNEVALPGFLDSFSAGVGVLSVLGGILLIVIGSLLPFVPFVALAGLGLRALARRRRDTTEPSPSVPAPPPPPTAASVAVAADQSDEEK